ncbi:ComEC/Rec2 family competence protein [Sideroxydans lithotrophicus]|uniref:Beta-lactamase domain protein n=1 Tax=Sideroxydans lithotrophicus (strain ES-1) TaxID=580332 RepID=D5CPL6_SIDLE|nr:MBL fold metallo-hydrolase [Sideroxydans lithotrophicus]ADE13011.1 beta-lactamase domain protein [Sideroxydans lithotrophicus ES-1]
MNTTHDPSLVVLDVGHGNANIIHENGVTVVVDTGLKGRLLEYLLHRNISQIELVILSHSDADHISGLAGMLSAGISVNAVVLNADADKNSEAWRDLIFVLDEEHYKNGPKLTVGLADGPLPIPGFKNALLEVAAPTRLLAAFGVGGKDKQDRLITSNSLSAVIRVLYNGTPVALLSGDMDEITLDEIISKKINAKALFLVFPHHGGLPNAANPTAFASKLMDTVQPQTVIFSLGREKHANPNAAILETILKHTNSVRIGCTQLSKQCSEEIPSATRTFAPALFSAGWKGSLCCAGTMEIRLLQPDISEPTKTEHQQFIIEHVPQALCQQRQR